MRGSFSNGPDPRGSGGGRGFSAKGILKNSTAALVGAKDLPNGEHTLDLQVVGIRENQNKDIYAQIILDIVPVNGKMAFGLNTTNIVRLSDLVGDDLGAVVGRILKVGRVSYENTPDGLQVLEVSEPKTERAAAGVKK